MKKTTDLYLAAAFLALGAKLENVNRDDPRHMEFSFEPSLNIFNSEVLNSATKLDLDAIETQWTNSELMVNATAYKDAIQKMKRVVHTR